MVDMEYLKRIKLVTNPWGQRILGALVLKPNYRIFSKVDIRIEHAERIPRGESVIFAMNHTDRFNYWPFQFQLWQMKGFPFTTVWVKGKYYKNALLAKGLDLCNLIPVPSMGYLLEEFYRKRFHGRMEKDVYRVLKDMVDGKALHGACPKAVAEILAGLGDRFIEFLRGYYDAVMDKVGALTREALFERKLSLIIFPEGTRSLTLAAGRTGLAQVALHTGKKVVPVGCNNSESVYRGSLPFARSGRITYRVGEPLSVEDRLAPFRIPEPFRLLSRDSQERYREHFEAATQVIMERIQDLLDEKYRAPSAAS